MLILAVESSCDETSVALVEDGIVRALETRTQSVHGPYGGVVPELAGRSHLEQVTELARAALSSRLRHPIDLVAATNGPGLIGSLLVGVQFARGFAFARGIPYRGIHHIEAHVWSPEIDAGSLPLPFLSLVVSGGHTLLILVRGVRDYEIVGETHDDALGEAYDKAGKLMGFEYPAGAEVDKVASSGSQGKYSFTTPMLGTSYDFSFSGLKTALLYQLKAIPESERQRAAADLLAGFQEAAIGSVIKKLELSLDRFSVRAVAASGGASANSLLRARLSVLAQRRGIPVITPPMKYCSDNAAMIGYLAWKLESAGVKADSATVARPRWPITQLTTRAQESFSC